MMKALQETYTYFQQKTESEKTDDAKWEKMKSLLPASMQEKNNFSRGLIGASAKEVMINVLNLYEKAVAKASHDTLTPYTERVLLLLNELNKGVSVEDLMQKSYSQRYDSSVKDTLSKKVLDFKGGDEEMISLLESILPEFSEPMAKKLQSLYSTAARKDAHFALEADHFKQTVSALESLGEKGETTTEEKLLFLIQDTNFDGSADIQDGVGAHRSLQIARIFEQTKNTLKAKVSPEEATDIIVRNIVQHMQSKSYGKYIQNLPENPSTQQFYDWMKEKLFNTKIVQEALMNSPEDPAYIFSSGAEAMKQQFENETKVPEEQKKIIANWLDKKLMNLNPKGKLKLNEKGFLVDQEGNYMIDGNKNPIQITPEIKEVIIKSVYHMTTTQVNAVAQHGGLMDYNTLEIAPLFNLGRGSTSRQMQEIFGEAEVMKVDLAKLLEGLSISMSTGLSSGGVMTAGLEIGYEKSRKIDENWRL